MRFVTFRFDLTLFFDDRESIDMSRRAPCVPAAFPGILCSLLLLPTCFVAVPTHAQETPQEQARRILEQSGVTGGLIVHLGCGDGRLTTALRARDTFQVQGWDPDPANVAKARAHVQSLGIYGKVSVDRWRGGRLPYIDSVVNLLVISGPSSVDREEIERVLCPGGVAITASLDDVQQPLDKFVKPWPEGIDQWTHYLHDASNNAVARDTVVGPPKHVQWLGDPPYLRHHDHLSGLSAMVSAGGRLFYIMDLGPRWSVQMPPQWTLIARDAFNGVILWQRPITRWHSHLWPLKRGPAQIMRRLVAVDDTVYVTLGVGAPVTAVDGATGAGLRTYEGTEGAEEILVVDGVMLALVNPELDAYKDLPTESVDVLRAAGRDWNWDEKPRRLIAFDAATGRLAWSRESRVAPVTLASAGGRVYFHDGDRVVCVNARSGESVWQSQPLPRWNLMHVLFGPTLVVHQDVILFAGGENMDPIRGGRDTMTALSAADGRTLWTAPHPPSGYASSEDVFVIDGLVWCADTTSRRDSGTFTGRDLHTGEVVREFPSDDWPHMPHHRCYRAKATCNYILTSRTGIEFVDLQEENWIAHHWVRGSCNYGILPCNGLVYAPPHSCACYPLAKLTGLNALAPNRPGEKRPVVVDDADRLERGLAYGEIPHREFENAAAGDWPTYRGDNQRSGATADTVAPQLAIDWQTNLGGRLSSVVIAGGRVYVASIDDHTVHALDAASGQAVWQFTAGGRVDSPPTVWQDLVLFGSADGSVYCLRAADGQLIWRFRAAPEDQRLMASEQVESAWPVHGSVLLRDGVVYCVAGRAMWLDGGLRLLRLDARTGRKLSETVMDDRYPGTDENLQRDIQWPNLPVALPDILSCDDRFVYMRSQPFDFEGQRTEVITPRNYEQQGGEGAHLFSPTGWLDDAWWHRSYWVFGRSFVGGAGGWYLAGYQAPAGRILVFDEESVYGFGRAPLQQVGTPNNYHLFACSRQPELVHPNPKQPPRKQGSSIYGRVVPTRLKYTWSEAVPLLGRAMVATRDTLFVAGPPAITSELEIYSQYGRPEIQKQMAEQVAAFAGQRGGILLAVSRSDGRRLAAYRLPSPPRFDGLAAAGGRLYLSTLDGKLQCLHADGGTALEAAPDVTPGPVASATSGFVATSSHPDFPHLSKVRVTKSDLGYRMQTAPREVGLALRKLEPAKTGRVELRVRVRPQPGATTPDTPGNAFLAFGDGPEDARLVKCGFRISGQRLYVIQGPLLAGESKSVPVDVRANEIAELTVVVDLERQQVRVTMHGQTVQAELERKLDAVSWVGCCVTSVSADFGPIEVVE